jgi:hypothetical protein
VLNVFGQIIGLRLLAETSFANPLQNAEMPKLPKLPKLFRHHMSYDIHIVSALYDIGIDNQIFLKKNLTFFYSFRDGSWT